MNTKLTRTRRHFKRASLLAFATLAAIGTAQAQSFRAYLASDGNDANPCTLVAPCRLLPAALNAVLAGGEVWMLDSANYNTSTVMVSKSVSILAVPGAIGSIVANGTDALHVAGPDAVVSLRNLVFVPVAGASGNGIRVTQAKRVTIERCLVANFPGDGVAAGSGSELHLNDTVVRGNTGNGIVVSQGAAAAIVRTTVSGNAGHGIHVIGNSTTDTTMATIGESSIHANGGTGVSVNSLAMGGARATITASQVAGNAHGLRSVGVTGGSTIVARGNLIVDNSGSGVAATVAGSMVHIADNVVGGNGIGLQRSAGTFESFGYNAVRGNTMELSGATTPVTKY